MQSSSRTEFANLMTGLAELYEKEITETGLEIWWAAMEKFEFSDVSRAMNAHVRDPDRGQFMPKPADIISQLEGGGDEQSLRAWQVVEETVKRVGPYRAIMFEDRAMHSAVEQIGGYGALCRATNDEWPFIRNNFCKLYRGMRSRPPTGDQYPLIAESNGGEKPLLIKSGKGPLLLEVSDAA